MVFHSCNSFTSVSGEKAEYSEFQPCVRLWLDKMRGICSGVHGIIDFSLIQSGSFEDLFGLEAPLRRGEMGHTIEDIIHFPNPAPVNSAETEGIHLQTTFYRDKHLGEKVDFLLNLLEQQEK